MRCRDLQIDLLNALITTDPQLLAGLVIVHGFKSIGKSFTVEKYLETLGVNHSIVRCDECITKRIMLQRCFKAIRTDSKVGHLYTDEILSSLGENFASFVTQMEKFNRQTGYSDQHVLVLDRIDQCMESAMEYLAAFAKMREQTLIKNITVVFVIATDIPKEVVTMNLPQVYFPPYTEDELITILQSSQLCVFGDDNIDNNPASYDFWCQYIKTVVDLFYVYTGSDMSLLMHICLKCWDRFTDPVRSGKWGVEDFLMVYRENMDMFKNENLMNNSAIVEYLTMELEQQLESEDVLDLPVHSKFILIACYLASFTEQKNDLHFFSKVKAVKYKKRASGDAKRNQTLMAKDDIDSRLLSPNFFDLERMLAILSVIYRSNAHTLNSTEAHPYDDTYEDRRNAERSKFTLSKNIDLNNQLATLFSLGLISKSANSDILGARVRWKCNVNWLSIDLVARELQFPILDYLVDV